MNTDTIRVLVVEDNPGDARLIREHLAEMSANKYDCVCAGRLSEAFDLMKRSIYHVMLLDLSLPDSQGFETFQRARDSGPDLPIVVLTGLDDKDLASRAVREGAQDYLLRSEEHTSRERV
ncbi:MAG: response regulator, partial [Candidatus Sumerlaeota bacterium]|nr:response regulator [Candidatus Sumerlaeota bacterium]